jgi:two-component system LytT family sensor kinase
MKLLFSLIQTIALFLLVAYVYCKSPAFRALRTEALLARHKLFLFLFFSALSIAGAHLGSPVEGSMADACAIGPVLAGIIAGPALGTAVGLAGGLHRFFLGGFTALAGGLSTTAEGLIGGLVHVYLIRKDSAEQVFSPKVAFVTTALAEAAQMAIILLVARPLEDALALVHIIALPMIAANSAGTALFMSIIRDRKNTYDKVGAASTARALRIAERILSLLNKGLNREIAPDLARIVHEETGVGAVAITDAEKVLAFVGYGSDHHKPGTPIDTPWTKKAITEHEVVFVDGVREPYRCHLSDECPLRSVLIVPLQIDDDVVGAIKLYEPAHRRFLTLNKILGEGLTILLSNQLLRSRYQEQKNLLVMAELKLAQAQIDPHFLFNSLNTIMAIIRKDAGRARELVNHLSNYFRKNLKRRGDLSTLEEELEHVRAYLEIEKARFEDQLVVEMEVDPSLLKVKVPTFTLQPLIENAIKHGISDMLTPGTARIRAYRQNGIARIDIEDNAGAYEEKNRSGDGLGIRIVDKRIRSLMGNGYGVSISCVPNELTRVSIEIPVAESTAP